ncbi:MAG: CvpA family protein [Phycisphaerales bacterium]|nr:MAG: CvpA family protein [Phycisphaerales bacterium]
MIMSLLAIGLCVLVLGVWAARGFLSSMIHMVCTLIAGAVAFASWEPISYFLLDFAKDGSQVLRDTAWALGLALPFAATLAILRLITNAVIRSNATTVRAIDMVGGGLCGAVSGIITAGIIVISIQFTRLDTEFWGYRPIEYTGSGSVERSSPLIFPVDKITARTYAYFSTQSLVNDEDTSLERLYPDLDIVPTSLRTTFGDGKAKNTLHPDDFEVMARYTVGEGRNLPIDQLLADRWGAGAAQKATTPEGGSYPNGSTIQGFAIKFNAGSKESNGQVVFGNAQVRLVCTDSEGTSWTFFPIAAVMQAEAAKLTLRRFRFDAPDVYFASVGGSSHSGFGVEFAVPPGFTPVALYVKNVRVMANEGRLAVPAAQYATTAERDNAVADGSLANLAGANLEVAENKYGGKTPGEVAEGPVSVRFDPTKFDDTTGLRISDRLPFTLHLTTVRGLTIEDEQKKNIISRGMQAFSREELSNIPLERSLQVQRLSVTNDTIIVQIDVSLGKQMSYISRPNLIEDDSKPVNLVDSNGTTYEPVGYVYENSADGSKTVSYDPGRPIMSLRELPGLSKSRPNDKLMLIFRVSRGVNLKTLGIGGETLAEFKPPILLNQPQGAN